MVDKFTKPASGKAIIKKINEIIEEKLENTATGTNALTIDGTTSTYGGSINIGYGSAIGAMGGVALGYQASSSGYGATAIGGNAEASANSAIQIGQGTNSTANSLSIGFNDAETNYQLLDGTTGKVPNDRLDMDTTPTNESTKPITSGGAYTALSGKQARLVSGTNIKTINNESILGDGNITISGGSSYTGGTGISIGTGNAINHSNSVTAATAGTSSVTSGSTLAVPYVTYDAQGHITASGTHTHIVSGFLTSHKSYTITYNV